MERTPYRVAVVGLGPRGLYAIERLFARARDLPPDVGLEVVAYDPHPRPGAGAIYDPEQPDYLRMNFAAEMVDMWWPGGGVVPTAERRPFSEWRAANRVGNDRQDRYPPRAEVGTYLTSGLKALLSAAPEQADLRVIPERIERLKPHGDGWCLWPQSGMPAEFDETLLCTGHLPSLDPQPPAAAAGLGVETVSAGSPAWGLSEAVVPAGAAVAIRGLALTFIDAALALTEGRGGRFVSGRRPHELSYEASGREPSALLPFSRSGRPMLAKPDPDLAASLPGVGAAGHRGRARLRSATAPLTVGGTLMRVLTTTADEMLAAGESGHPTTPAVELERRLTRAEPPDAAAQEFRSQLERSLEIGVGAARGDSLWALGEAWRALYPTIVERFGGAGLSADEWPRFLRLAAEMERVAFGPPVVNGAKLLALIDHGLVDLSFCAGADVEGGELRSPRGSTRQVAMMVDAVSPAPGAAHLERGPVAELRDCGLVRVPPGRRGIEIAGDGSCVSGSGLPTPGLAALGRISEDWVVGNDTLNRSLHPHSDAWARAVVGRALAVSGSRRATESAGTVAR